MSETETNSDSQTTYDVATPTPSRRGGRRRSARIDGADLLPDLGNHTVSVVEEYRYWVGVLPGCPREHIDLAGINFPKINENLVDQRGSNKKQRVPVIGAIVTLTADKIRRMRERLPRTVIRFYDDQGEKEEPGTGLNVGDNYRQPRRGQVITIPTAENVETARRNNRPARQYSPHPNDRPAAEFMFCVLCKNQERGERGDVYPDTLDKTGLEWPGTPID